MTTLSGPDTLVQPAVSQQPNANAEGGAKKKGKRLKMILVIVVVIALAAFMEKGKFIKPHYSAKHPAPLGEIDTLGGTELTVNLADGHLVQLSLALQLTAVASSKEIDADQPIFEDAAISILGAQTDASLLAPGGRDAVKAQLLARFQQIAGDVDGVPQITAVYYTDFIIQ
ncbi:MAG TPA: flagellar basal body-associated FliL family protein [Acidimicrobiales bacterium]|nr:flagellar basal body-associated FliL family protein [Acidimicrobiales bacterium]